MAIPHPLWSIVERGYPSSPVKIGCVSYWLPLSGRCHLSLTSVTLLLLLLRFYSLKPPWSVGRWDKKFVVQDQLRATICHRFEDGSSLAQLFSNRWDIGMILAYQGCLEARTSPERYPWASICRKRDVRSNTFSTSIFPLYLILLMFPIKIASQMKFFGTINYQLKERCFLDESNLFWPLTHLFLRSRRQSVFF